MFFFVIYVGNKDCDIVEKMSIVYIFIEYRYIYIIVWF